VVETHQSLGAREAADPKSAPIGRQFGATHSSHQFLCSQGLVHQPFFGSQIPPCTNTQFIPEYPLGVNIEMRLGGAGLQDLFETAEVTELVGIPSILLNKFVERGQYGVQASVRAGRGRGSRRLFSKDDLFGIALVWWLFESGLRAKVIQFVLNQICGRKLNSQANDAARLLNQREPDLLLIERTPRTEAKEGVTHPGQRALLTRREHAIEQIKTLGTRTSLALPVGNLYSRLKGKMDKLRPESAKQS
jgi:hypothetical protein